MPWCRSLSAFQKTFERDSRRNFSKAKLYALNTSTWLNECFVEIIPTRLRCLLISQAVKMQWKANSSGFTTTLELLRDFRATVNLSPQDIIVPLVKPFRRYEIICILYDYITALLHCVVHFPCCSIYSYKTRRQIIFDSHNHHNNRQRLWRSLFYSFI